MSTAPSPRDREGALTRTPTPLLDGRFFFIETKSASRFAWKAQPCREMLRGRCRRRTWIDFRR